MKTASTVQSISALEATEHQGRALRLAPQQRRAIREAQQAWHRFALHLLQEPQLRAPAALGVTSAIRGEGKTTSSICLAAALAKETGEPVLLVDANLGHPGIARTCQLAPVPGLSDYLQDRAALENTLRPTSLPNLTAVVAGEMGRQRAEHSFNGLGTSLRRRMPDLIAQWKNGYAHIILDLPGVLGDVNAEEMARRLDGTLLVVRAGVTPLEKAAEASRLLEKARLLAAVHIGRGSSLPRWMQQLLAE